MKKELGIALISVLVIIAAVVMFGGALERFMPAPQLSETAQRVIDPAKPVNKFPFTSLGKLKDEQVKLDVKKAEIGVVDKELKEKTDTAQATANTIFGSVEKPGLVGTGVLALLAAIGTRIYDKTKMYSAEEVKLIKTGETVL